MADQPQQPPRDTQLNVRIDGELLRQARKRSQAFGGLGAVIRAFLQAFVRGELEPPAGDLERELTSAPVKTVAVRHRSRPSDSKSKPKQGV